MTLCYLDQLAQDESASVVLLPDALKSRARLVSFGLLPGCPVTVLNNSHRNALLVMARGMRIALSRQEARFIQVARG
jgi:Fe2+ transport system protein FeoA